MTIVTGYVVVFACLGGVTATWYYNHRPRTAVLDRAGAVTGQESSDAVSAETLLRAGAYQGASRAYHRLLNARPGTTANEWQLRLCYASSTILSHQGISAQEEKDADRALAPFFSFKGAATVPTQAQVAVAWRLRIYYSIQHRFTRQAEIQLLKARAFVRTAALSEPIRQREFLLLDLLSAQNDFLFWRLLYTDTHRERARQTLERIFSNRERVRLYLTIFDPVGMDEDAQRKLLQTGAVSPLGRLSYLDALLGNAPAPRSTRAAAKVAAFSAASAALAVRQIGLGIYYRPTKRLSLAQCLPESDRIPIAVPLDNPNRIDTFRKNVLRPAQHILHAENGTLVLFAVPDDLSIVAFALSGTSGSKPGTAADLVRMKIIIDRQLAPGSKSAFTDIHSTAVEWQAAAAMEVPPSTEPQQAAELSRRLLRWLRLPNLPRLDKQRLYKEHLVMAAPAPLDGLPWAALGVPGRQWDPHDQLIRLVDCYSIRVAPNGIADLLTATPLPSLSPLRVLTLSSPSLVFASEQNKAAASLAGWVVSNKADTVHKASVLNELTRSDVVDIALHGTYDQKGEAGFQLPDGALVTASDLRWLPFHPGRLAVIATCATTGSQIDPDFLATSAQQAGFASVVSSTIVLDDKATTEILKKFYKNTKGRMRKDDALCKAIFDAREDSSLRQTMTGEKWYSPCWWAGLRLSGDPSPLYP